MVSVLMPDEPKLIVPSDSPVRLVAERTTLGWLALLAVSSTVTAFVPSLVARVTELYWSALKLNVWLEGMPEPATGMLDETCTTSWPPLWLRVIASLLPRP